MCVFPLNPNAIISLFLIVDDTRSHSINMNINIRLIYRYIHISTTVLPFRIRRSKASYFGGAASCPLHLGAATNEAFLGGVGPGNAAFLWCFQSRMLVLPLSGTKFINVWVSSCVHTYMFVWISFFFFLGRVQKMNE